MRRTPILLLALITAAQLDAQTPSDAASRSVELLPDLNLVAWTGPDTPVAQAVAPIATTLDSLFARNAGADAFRTFGPARPPILNQIDILNYGDGFWLLMSGDATWNQPGLTESTVITSADGSITLTIPRGALPPNIASDEVTVVTLQTNLGTPAVEIGPPDLVFGPPSVLAFNDLQSLVGAVFLSQSGLQHLEPIAPDQLRARFEAAQLTDSDEDLILLGEAGVVIPRDGHSFADEVTIQPITGVFNRDGAFGYPLGTTVPFLANIHADSSEEYQAGQTITLTSQQHGLVEFQIAEPVLTGGDFFTTPPPLTPDRVPTGQAGAGLGPPPFFEIPALFTCDSAGDFTVGLNATVEHGWAMLTVLPGLPPLSVNVPSFVSAEPAAGKCVDNATPTSAPSPVARRSSSAPASASKRTTAVSASAPRSPAISSSPSTTGRSPPMPS